MKRKIFSILLALVLVLSFSLMTAVPALAAPVVASVTETAFGTFTTDHDVNMPATVNAGDLLIVLFTNDGSATVTTPAGWTVLASDAANGQVRLSVYYKVAAGTESGTTVNFVTSASRQAAAQVYRITDWHGTTPPEISTAATDTSTAPDPAALSPSWGEEDTLWLAVAGQDRGDQSGTTAYPDSYTDGISTQSSDAGFWVCRMHSARKVLAAASEDPSAFTIPEAEQWVAFTIAVGPAAYDLTMAADPEVGGTATDLTNESPYTEGTEVSINAVAAAGYQFANWTAPAGLFGNATAAETTFTMPAQNVTVTANFVAVYNLTMAADPEVGGTATDLTDESPYTEGTEVSIKAVAAAGYQFVNWTAPAGVFGNATAAETTFTMPAQDVTVTANFVVAYDLTMAADPEVGGTATDLTNESPYAEGTEVSIKAVAAAGYQFVNWTAPVGVFGNATAAETTFTMPAQNVTVTANFVAVYDLTMAADPEVGGTATDLTNESPYTEGTEVSINAVAAADYYFVKWTAPAGVFGNATAAETTFTIPAQDVTVTANFEEVYPSVTTKAATKIAPNSPTNSATLNMNYTTGNYTSVDVRFAYKKSPATEWSYTPWEAKSASGTYAKSITGLTADTRYEFKAQLEYNDTEIIEGATRHFTTTAPLDPPPSGTGCFIATAAYGTPTAKQIDVLREFRDEVLLESTAGSQFVALYYQFSPPVAEFIAGNELLRTLVRELLVDPIVWIVETTGAMWRN